MRGGIQKERAQVPDCLCSSWKWGCLGDRGDGPHLRHQHPPTLTYILCNAGCYRMGTIRVPILALWEEQWNPLMNLFSWCFVKNHLIEASHLSLQLPCSTPSCIRTTENCVMFSETWLPGVSPLLFHIHRVWWLLYLLTRWANGGCADILHITSGRVYEHVCRWN